MGFVLAISEDRVPSTKEPDPYMHVFLDAGQGNILAFFEIPNSPPMSNYPNTPSWVQHIAFKVKDVATLERVKKNVEARGLEVVGPTNHELFYSIYFFDPNGHRIELAADVAGSAATAPRNRAQDARRLDPDQEDGKGRGLAPFEGVPGRYLIFPRAGRPASRSARGAESCAGDRRPPGR